MNIIKTSRPYIIEVLLNIEYASEYINASDDSNIKRSTN